MSQSEARESLHTYNEIVRQPEAWAAVLQEVQDKAERIRTHWNDVLHEPVIFTGCGSPYYLARTAAVIFRGVVGAPAEAHPASDLLLFPEMTLGARRPRLLLAISRSGETSEVLNVVQRFNDSNLGSAMAITCYGDAPLAKLASQAVVAHEAQEQSLAQTRSFTSMLVATQALIFTLAGRPLSGTFLRLPESGAALIDEYHELARSLGHDASLERFYFLGGGPFYGLACEAMLKMKEMSQSISEAFHVLEFRHGPMAMVNDQTLIVGLVSETALLQEAAVLHEMRALGARVLAITPAQLPDGAADYQVVLPAGLTDVERGALYLPILQLLALYRTLYKGLNPDQPANLSAFIKLDLNLLQQRRASGEQSS